MCPRCEQDWLVRVRLVHLKVDAILCPDCEALWLTAESIGRFTFEDYGTFMVEHGRPNPDSKAEIEYGPPLEHRASGDDNEPEPN